jgi:hypothetical protein
MNLKPSSGVCERYIRKTSKKTITLQVSIKLIAQVNGHKIIPHHHQ